MVLGVGVMEADHPSTSWTLQKGFQEGVCQAHTLCLESEGVVPGLSMW